MLELTLNSISSFGLKVFATSLTELESEFPARETKKKELKTNSIHLSNTFTLRISPEDSLRRLKFLLDDRILFKYPFIVKIKQLNQPLL